MRLYDISQELFSSVVYPGDAVPKAEAVYRMERGEVYNLSNLSLSAHNGTHVDAPFHFFEKGKTVEEISLSKTVGKCFVAAFDGELSANDARNILFAARKCDEEGEAAKRILLKGNAIVTIPAAEVFAAEKIDLVGVESQSVGDAAHPAAVHRILLKEEIVLLEGIRLGEVNEGKYFLFAAPLSLGGLDGAPCRAVLLSEGESFS